MKLDYKYLREQKGLIPLALIGVSTAFAFLILIKTTSFVVASAKAETVVRRAVSHTKPNAEALRECEAKSSAIADELKKSNLFSPPVPEHNPVSSVLGILGDEVLIGDKWYKAGDKVGDARIVAVEATQVRVEWQGREKVFTPLDATTESASAGPRRLGRNTNVAAQSSKSGSGVAEMVLIGQTGNVRTAGKSSKEKPAAADKKAEKQRQATAEKEFQKLSKSLAKKTQADWEKAAREKKKKTKEKAAQQKTKKPAKKR